MNHIFACPECKQKLRLTDEFLGKKVRCPSCRNAFRLPAEAPGAPSPPPTPVALTDRPAPPRPLDEIDDDEDGTRPETITDRPAPPRPESAPRKRRRPPEFAPVAFSVKVKDPDKELEGAMKAKLTPEGLILTFKKKEILLPAGDGAEYLRSNVLSVPYEGRDLELTVLKPFHYTKRLTRDIADFLEGGLDDIHGPDYRIPWYLIVLAMLPVGIPILTLGGALPGILGGGMAGLSLVVAQREQWSLATRIVLCLVIALVAYALFGALLVLVLMNQK